MREAADALKESIKTPFEKGISSLTEYQNLLLSGLITIEEFNRASAQAFGATPEQAAFGGGGFAGAQEAGGAAGFGGGFGGGAFGGGLGGGFAGGGGEGGELGALQAKLDAEREMLIAHQEQLSALKEEALLQDNQTQLALLTELQAQTMAALDANAQAQSEVTLAGFGATANALTSILKTTAGEQSGIFKAMFAVSKAFAIADSIVKIQQGAATALAAPFPQNIIQMAAVIAQGASVLSTIQSTAANFEGGGRTPSGPRAGGVDGRGGFMAVLHPDEKITDLRKEGEGASEGGASVEWTINVVNQMGGEVKTNVDSDANRIDILLKRVDKDMASNIRTGRGATGDAIAETFNVQRGRGG